jgi:hypothetical protein
MLQHLNRNTGTIMTDFFFICKHLVGTQESKGKESADPGCTKKFKTGSYCTADTEAHAKEAKQHCHGSDFLKIISFKKKK